MVEETASPWDPTVGTLFRALGWPFRGTSLMRNRIPLGPCSRTMPRVLWWPCGGGLFLISEVRVPLYRNLARKKPRSPTVGLCLGPFAGPMGRAVSCERGAPVEDSRQQSAPQTHLRQVSKLPLTDMYTYAEPSYLYTEAPIRSNKRPHRDHSKLRTRTAPRKVL